MLAVDMRVESPPSHDTVIFHQAPALLEHKNTSNSVMLGNNISVHISLTKVRLVATSNVEEAGNCHPSCI